MLDIFSICSSVTDDPPLHLLMLLEIAPFHHGGGLRCLVSSVKVAHGYSHRGRGISEGVKSSRPESKLSSENKPTDAKPNVA